MSFKLWLQRSIPGSKTTINAHIKRADNIAIALNERFKLAPNPYQWQAKHLKWFLKEQTAALAPSTRYNYWLTCRELAALLGRWPDWEPYLKGEWNPHPTKGAGGRPSKLAHTRNNIEKSQ
jgi:hypothetical protein